MQKEVVEQLRANALRLIALSRTVPEASVAKEIELIAVDVLKQSRALEQSIPS